MAPASRARAGAVAALIAAASGACTPSREVPATPRPQTGEIAPETLAALRSLVLSPAATAPPDPTNRYADDPRAAALGQKWFYDPRFSGPLLDDANTGLSGTLGKLGETGKVACASCHTPQSRAFVDSRSPRAQLSLASGWTHRKAPALLDVAQVVFLTWDGRRDTAFSQVFAPIESPVEFNSSRLFVAQQIARLYAADYEAIFGPLPQKLAAFSSLPPERAGCTALPDDHETVCPVPGHDDPDVTRVVVNFGKAIQAFTRRLSCGRSRFDAWMEGDRDALDAEERAGAVLFVTKGACHVCHSGPYLTDQAFHNLGVPGGSIPFTGVDTSNDPGAAAGLAAVRGDWLNSRGPFSDGDDGRLDRLPADPSSLLGAFKTPGLRCVSRRKSFMHNGWFRSLEDAVSLVSRGAARTGGFVGVAHNPERELDTREQAQIVAFLRALDGDGPDPSLLRVPELPPSQPSERTRVSTAKSARSAR